MLGARLAALVLFAAGVLTAGTTLVLPPAVALVVHAWLPGRVLLGLIGERSVVRSHTPATEGPGRLAWDFVASLALATIGLLPAFLAGASLAEGARLLGVVWTVVALAAFVARGTRVSWNAPRPVDRQAWAAFVLAVLVCLPAVMIYAGGTVDDWWDLAVVRKWATTPTLDFREAFLGTGLHHPRWGWNVWLAVQACLVRPGIDPWMTQARLLAPLVALLVVAAQAAFAAAVFRERRRVVVWVILATPLWLWGTEALPYFVRPHQDKFVAGLVALPVLLAAVVRDLRWGDGRSRLLLAMAALVTVSLHPLVYMIGCLGAVALALGWRERDGETFALRMKAMLVGQGPVLATFALYPVIQAWRLAPLFAAQGISLADPGNPVVRAHLWLGRLVGAPDPWYFVHPAAVFGPVALVAALGLYRLRSRVGGRAERALGLLTALPCLLIFVPGIAAAMGKVWVPWMLYRLGWLVPVPLLLGRALAAARALPGAPRRRAALALLAVLLVVTTLPVARDRVARDMSEHPRERDKQPTGALAEVYEFLAAAPLPGTVLAMQGFSALVPATAGREVVSFSERGTLVFSPDEATAYRRLADTSAFFDPHARVGERRRIAERYGVAYAVFPRRWVMSEHEDGLLDQVSAEGFLDSYRRGHASAWAEREAVAAALPTPWAIVFANDAAFVVATAGREAVGLEAASENGGGESWLEAIGATTSPQRRGPAPLGPEADRRRARTVGASIGYPGASVTLTPAPLSLGISEKLVWEAVGPLGSDRPVAFEMLVDLGRACRVEAVEVVPYLPRARREALTLQVAQRSVAVEAVDGVPIVVDIEPRHLRRVRLSVRSLLGAPPSITAVRILGDPERCDAKRPAFAEPQFPQRGVGLEALLELARQFPQQARPRVAIAARRAEASPAEAQALLAHAVAASPESVFARIELGAALDRQGDFDAAVAQYETALRLDSNNAWARGVVAWARYRAGWKLAAAWHAWNAWRSDRRYGDALTIAAHIARDLGLSGSASALLAEAQRLDPLRNWPVLAAAQFAATDGRLDDARAVLIAFLRRLPTDQAVRDYLALIERRRMGEGEP